MTDEEWSRIQFFKKSEFLNRPDRMNNEFMKKLDNWRGSLNAPIHILEAFATEGHAPKSYHYLGRAVDCRIIGKGILEHFLSAIRSPFGGVGIYTWGAGGPFIHLDDRQETQKIIWLCFSPNVYEPLNVATFGRLYELS